MLHGKGQGVIQFLQISGIDFSADEKTRFFCTHDAFRSFISLSFLFVTHGLVGQCVRTVYDKRFEPSTVFCEVARSYELGDV